MKMKLGEIVTKTKKSNVSPWYRFQMPRATFKANEAKQLLLDDYANTL